MSDTRVVLVTGVGDYWGARVAEKLVEQTDHYIIGLDNELPQEEIQGLDFIQADVRNSLLVDLLKSEGVEVVCHLKFKQRTRRSESTFDLNVMGTMKVLGACADAGVKSVVLHSSTAVYGAHPGNSAFLKEDHPLAGSRSYGYTRDWVEIESFCSGFRRQTPDLKQTVLRFANIVGPTADTPMTRFLKEPKAPVLWGFDPNMQVIHEDDVVGALVHSVMGEKHGVFNVAAEEVMPLSKLMGLAGKIPVPVYHLFAYWSSRLLDVGVDQYKPIELDYLRYPWVGDLKGMRDVFAYEPLYTAEETLREFAREQRMQGYKPESYPLEDDEERLWDTIERRQRLRERQVARLDEQAEEVANE